jgi:hypothetical protein
VRLQVPRVGAWAVAIWVASALAVLQAQPAPGHLIDVAVAPSGAAGFGDGSERWQLGVSIGAWRVPGGALSTEELYVRRPGLTHDQLRPLQDRLSGYALARLRLKAAPAKRRYPSGLERWEAVLESIEAAKVVDRELVAWVETMRKPIVVRDDVLGVLTFDRTLSRYQAGRSLGSVRYELTIETSTAPDAVRDAATIKALRGVVTAVESGVPRYRQAATAKLFDVYNDSWRNDDEPRLTRTQFASRLTLDSVHVLPDGGIEVFFQDGDLFAGQVIHLRLDTPERVRSIDIAG